MYRWPRPPRQRSEQRLTALFAFQPMRNPSLEKRLTADVVRPVCARSESNRLTCGSCRSSPCPEYPALDTRGSRSGNLWRVQDEVGGRGGGLLRWRSRSSSDAVRKLTPCTVPDPHPCLAHTLAPPPPVSYTSDLRTRLLVYGSASIFERGEKAEAVRTKSVHRDSLGHRKRGNLLSADHNRNGTNQTHQHKPNRSTEPCTQLRLAAMAAAN